LPGVKEGIRREMAFSCWLLAISNWSGYSERRIKNDKICPSFLLSPRAKQTIIVFGRNEGIVNDGILVLRATNDERRDDKRR
jgi:hypothetical protein